MANLQEQLREQRYLAPLADALMEARFSTPPSGGLVPESEWKRQKREELLGWISGRDLRARIQRGFETLFYDLQAHATAVEKDSIEKECHRALGHLMRLVDLRQEPPQEETFRLEAFQDCLHFSDTTLEHFYQAGVRTMESHSHEAAADVFFVLSLLDFRKHNIWIALGVSEQYLGHLDLALEAYAMAILTDHTQPWPYLYSAECYRDKGQKTDLKECLSAARMRLSRLSEAERKQANHLLDQLV